MGRLIRRAAALGLLAALAGCSSQVSGQGAGEGGDSAKTGAFPTGPVSTTPTATASKSPGNGAGGGGNGGGTGGGNSGGGNNGGGNGGGGGGTKTTTPSKPPTQSNAPTGQPQIQMYQAIAGPTCGSGHTGTSQVTLTWRTTNSTEVWIQISQVAFDTGDPKVSGGVGPLTPSGTKTLPFDCANGNLYYKLRAYNPTHNTNPTGINLQVPRDS